MLRYFCKYVQEQHLILKRFFISRHISSKTLRYFKVRELIHLYITYSTLSIYLSLAFIRNAMRPMTNTLMQQR